MYWALRRFVMRTLAADEDTKLDEPLFHYLKNTGLHPNFTLNFRVPAAMVYLSDNSTNMYFEPLLDHVLCKTAGFLVIMLSITASTFLPPSNL